jgi:hypothetical protein
MVIYNDGDLRTNPNTTIDLDGEDGNAFALLSLASSVAKRCKYSKDKSDRLQEDMMSSDYKNLVRRLDREFGSVLTFVTSDEELVAACKGGSNE